MIRHAFDNIYYSLRAAALEKLINQTVQNSALTLDHNPWVSIEFITNYDQFKLTVVDDGGRPSVRVDRAATVLRYDFPVGASIVTTDYHYHQPLTMVGDHASPKLVTKQLVTLAVGQ